MQELDFITIGKRIRKRRKALHMTQEVVASRLDVNASHVSNIECGRTSPSLTILVNIANILNCSVDFFLSDEYTYVNQLESDLSLDEVIVEKLRYCSQEKKETVSRIIDAL